MTWLSAHPRLRAFLGRVRPLVALHGSLRATPSVVDGLKFATYRTLIWLVDATRFSRRLSVAAGALSRRLHVTLALLGPAARVVRVTLPVQPQAYWTLYEILFAHAYRPLAAISPDVVVDAGANIGLATVYLHELFPEARFICVEADPRNLPLLRRNLAQNGVRSDLIAAALASSAGQVTFRLHRAASDYSSSLSTGFPDAEYTTVQVPATTLRAVLASCGVRRVGLLKIDIEGGEFEVLDDSCGAMAELDYVTGEFHGFAGDVDALIHRVCHAAGLVVLRRTGDASLAMVHLGRPA